MEKWKIIPGYENYEASSQGRVRSLDRYIPYIAKGKAESKQFRKGRILVQTKNSVTGYLYVHLGRGKIDSVHSLIALTFIGDRPQGAFVCHKDGNRENNARDNLEYGTPLENFGDMVSHGTMCNGEKHPQAKLTAAEVIDIRKRAKAGEPMSRIALSSGVSYLTVRNIVNRKTWRWISEDKECNAT